MNSIKIAPLHKPIEAKITIPGSKSYTQRALFIAALSKNPVTILHPLFCDDTKASIECLTRLGIEVLIKRDSIEVTNDRSSVADRSYDLDANLSGTTLRFMLALAAIIPGVQTLYGKEGLNKRPVRDLVDGLRQLGAEIEYLGAEGYPPIRVSSSRLSQGMVKMSGAVSSQYLSAILMIAPMIGKVTVEVGGEQVSRPYIDMTIDTMHKFGVAVSNDSTNRYIISAGQHYNLNQYFVEADVSSACYFAAIASLTKSTITFKNMNPLSLHADMSFFKILESMGNSLSFGCNQITIHGQGVKPIEVDMMSCPDQVQTVAVLAAFAEGITKISGVQSLRVKETERVLALEQALQRMGIQTSSTPDTITICGGSPKPALIDTYGDHRMAMAFAVAGTKLAGIEIQSPHVVEKSFPDFWKKLQSLGVGVHQ